MLARLGGLLVKETIQLLRDRTMLWLIFYLYTGCVLICTYALSIETSDVLLATVDLDHTPASRAFAESFAVSESFLSAGPVATSEEAAEWLQDGRAAVALIVPAGFQRDIERGETATVQLLLDGSNSNVAAQARGYAIEIVSRFQAGLSVNHLSAAPGVSPSIRVWYNPTRSYTSFMLLSMVALAAFLVGVIYPAASIVREKETGTIEQLRVTPIGTTELFIAKTLPTMAIGVLATFPSLLIVLWFGIPMRGSLLLFLGATSVFLISAIAIGVFIGVVSGTLQQALLLSFFGLFPLMFLSGTIVPVESMPDVLQTLTLVSPLRHYMDVILGIFLKGSGGAELWPQALALVSIGVPMFGIAAMVFSRAGR